MNRIAHIACFLTVPIPAAPAWAGEPEPGTLWEAVYLVVGEAAHEKGDYAKAFRQYLIAASKNNGWSPITRYYLGLMYDNGQGVVLDCAEAMHCYRTAAEQSYAKAQLRLGFIYDTGRGVTQDHVEALKWYRLVAERDHSKAQLVRGVAYEKGMGVPKDLVLAYKWYNIAAASVPRLAAVRDDLEKKMTPAQVAEAQRLAREWWAKLQKKELAGR